MIRRALLLLWIGTAACGASSRPPGGAGGDDDDDDTGGDGDADGDPRPDCPEGPELVLGDACAEQADCEAPRCGRQGGVCIEEDWTCGSCDYCFFTRTPHVEDPGMTCDPVRGACVPP